MKTVDSRPIIIRADASTRIGTGHLMRCLALAQGWQERGGEVVFVSFCESPALLQRLQEEGFQVIPVKETHPAKGDWECLSRILAQHPESWVILDGYHFDQSYQVRIKERGHPLLVIDDIAHLEHYYADVILNQNIHADALSYSCESYTKLLLGPRFVLLRREFWEWRGWERNISQVGKRILVTLGGADSDNVTLKVVKAFQQLKIDGLEAVVVIGPANPHWETLQSIVRTSGMSIRLESAVKDMPHLMAWADVAISAAGSTCWELLFMGLPSLLIVMAGNQRLAASKLSERGLAINLGEAFAVTPQAIAVYLKELIENFGRRLQTAQLGKELIDGLGIERVLYVLVG